MKFLKVMLVIALLVANFSVAAQAFSIHSHCPKSMMANGKMMDCCKEKSGKPAKCPCASCDSCTVLSPVAFLTVYQFNLVSVKAAQEVVVMPALSRLTPLPEFRPPDFLV